LARKIHRPTTLGAGTNFDENIWNDIVQVIDDGDLTPQETLEDFILFLRRVNFARFVARFEVFKHTLDIPGSIVDCGVFKGHSLMLWAKLVEIYSPGDTFKKIIGFDTFSGFPKLNKKDGPVITRRDKFVGGFSAKSFLPILEKVIEINQRDSMIPRFQRVILQKGDVKKTIPEFVKKNSGTRISLLHLDLDLYEPTKIALENLYPLVSPGGVVLLDDYGMSEFQGESLAFDEYFGENKPKLTKFPFTPSPGAYFIKK